MLCTRCPSCGSPAPVSLAEPTVLACESCGHRGTTPPETQRGLAKADAVLRTLDVTRRKLNAKQRRALTSAGWQRFRFLLYSFLFSSPLLVFAMCGGILYLDRVPNWFGAAICFGPLMLFVGVSALGYVLVKRRIADARRHAAAIPPSAPGAPVRCHVCGGPLSTNDVDAVTECAYCSADNLVSADVLSGRAGHKHFILEGFTAEVQRQATDVGADASRLAWGMLGFTAVAPFLSTCLVCSGLTALAMSDAGEPDLEDVYAVVEVEAGQCIGHVIYDGTVIHFGSDRDRPGGIPERLDYVGAPIVRELRAPELMDLRVVGVPYGQREPRRGRVSSVFGNLIGDNKIEVHFDGDPEPRRAGIRGLCLEP